ncbi:MAG: hypothetical protein HYT28_01860 [Parcubacteria group bacterium]|nr:hypothetical protein [Parcubacteria group bacterium]
MFRNFNTTDHIEKKIFWALSLFAALFVALYIYFVANATIAIVEREQIEDDIATLGGKLAAVESNYLAATAKLTPEFARSLGFQEITVPHFVSRTGLALSSSR